MAYLKTMKSFVSGQRLMGDSPISRVHPVSGPASYPNSSLPDIISADSKKESAEIALPWSLGIQHVMCLGSELLRVTMRPTSRGLWGCILFCVCLTLSGFDLVDTFLVWFADIPTKALMIIIAVIQMASRGRGATRLTQTPFGSFAQLKHVVSFKHTFFASFFLSKM